MSATAPQQTYDIGTVLDEGAWSRAQILYIVLAALALVLDGFDGQLIGYAAPVLLKEWHITRDALAPVVAAGLFGMAIGSVFAGIVGDRIGRRNAIIGSVVLFGIATIAVGFSPDRNTMAILRFVAGLGIGGALPSATTLAAEFAPAANRALVVTATIVCYPLGGMLAGLFATYVLAPYGWRTLFIAGGVIPVLYALVLILLIAESPRFLARHERRWPELVALLARMGRPAQPGAAFTDNYEQKVLEGAARRAGFGALFEGTMARDTLALWAAFFFTLLAIYSAFSWLPTMLANEKMAGAATASLTAYNLGGVLGALGCAVAITRFGSRWPMVVCAAGGAVSAFVANMIPHTDATLLVWALGVHGLFTNAVQSTLYALSAFLYPTLVRARGTATGLAVGRLGAILSAFTGAALITAGGATAFLNVLGLSMIVVAVALAVIGRHIRPSAGIAGGALVESASAPRGAPATRPSA